MTRIAMPEYVSDALTINTEEHPELSGLEAKLQTLGETALQQLQAQLQSATRPSSLPENKGDAVYQTPLRKLPKFFQEALELAQALNPDMDLTGAQEKLDRPQFVGKNEKALYKRLQILLHPDKTTSKLQRLRKELEAFTQSYSEGVKEENPLFIRYITEVEESSFEDDETPLTTRVLALFDKKTGDIQGSLSKVHNRIESVVSSTTEGLNKAALNNDTVRKGLFLELAKSADEYLQRDLIALTLGHERGLIIFDSLARKDASFPTIGKAPSLKEKVASLSSLRARMESGLEKEELVIEVMHEEGLEEMPIFDYLLRELRKGTSYSSLAPEAADFFDFREDKALKSEVEKLFNETKKAKFIEAFAALSPEQLSAVLERLFESKDMAEEALWKPIYEKMAVFSSDEVEQIVQHANYRDEVDEGIEYRSADFYFAQVDTNSTPDAEAQDGDDLDDLFDF